MMCNQDTVENQKSSDSIIIPNFNAVFPPYKDYLGKVPYIGANNIYHEKPIIQKVFGGVVGWPDRLSI